MFWKQSGLLMTGLDVNHRACATMFLTRNDTRTGGDTGGGGVGWRVVRTCVNEGKEKLVCKQNKKKGATEFELKTERDKKKTKNMVIKNTFKGVNSRRVTILGVVSIPPWHSPDKSALMLLIREGERNGRREVKEREC